MATTSGEDIVIEMSPALTPEESAELKSLQLLSVWKTLKGTTSSKQNSSLGWKTSMHVLQTKCKAWREDSRTQE